MISGEVYTTQWTYNTRGQVETITYPGGETAEYGYDGYGREASLTIGTTTFISQASYDAAGRLSNLALGNGGHATYSYFPWSQQGGRLQRIQSGSAGGVQDYQNLAYQYDAAGNVTVITDTLNSGQVQSFTYDVLDRLTTASTNAVGTGQYNRSWTHTPLGNIYSDGRVFSYSADHPHAVSSVAGGPSYQYDLNGAATTITPTTGTPTQLAYDYEGRVTAVSGPATMTIIYDGDGQRIYKKEGSTETRYVGNWSEESVSGGTTTTTNYYWFAGRRVVMQVGANYSYLYADHLGSTVKTTGGSSGLELYDAYGKLRGTTTVATPYRYTGQREESALGLYDYGARWYDPGIGRFVQADSIVPNPSNPQSLNRYSYVLNNPMRYIDLTGHEPQDTQDFLGGLLAQLFYNNTLNTNMAPKAGESTWTSVGRALGIAFAVYQGVSEITGGLAVIGGGGGVSATGLGAAVGVPAMAVGAVAVSHGVFLLGGAAASTMMMIAQGGSSEITSPAQETSGRTPKRPGMNGLPDHVYGVNQLSDQLEQIFPGSQGYTQLHNTSLTKYGSSRRPDVVILKNNKLILIGEVARTTTTGKLVSREITKM